LVGGGGGGRAGVLACVCSLAAGRLGPGWMDLTGLVAPALPGCGLRV